ncbi:MULTISPECIES: hypothetical protein [unclassified Saccharothrix]|uniref:hypothetical protein n=1 Tax=unclassified Saccharothrix TaxID=2593673 RepID=UPI00307F68D7
MWSHDSGFEVFDARVDAADESGARGAALLDRGLVRFAAGLLEDAQSDLDDAGDVLMEAGNRAAAAVAASIASLTARCRGDREGAVARAMFARGWAPPETVAAVAGHIAVAEAALDAHDPGPGLWAYMETTNVFGDNGLGDDTREALAAYADWLNEGDYAERRPTTPDLTGHRADPRVLDAVGRALLGEIPVDGLTAAQTATTDTLAHVAAGAALGVLHFRRGDGEEASETIVDAHLFGATIPPD